MDVGDCFIMDESLLQSKRNRIKKNPWITSGIIASIAKKYNLYDLWRKSVRELKNGNPLLYSNYKDYRKSLIINYAKKAHRLKRFKKAEGNSKETWKIISEIRGKHKVKIKPSFIIDGNVIEERRVIANGFNKLNECDNGLTIEPIPNYTDYVKNSVESSIYLSECSSKEINQIIKELSPNKACNIPIRVLKRI